MGYSVRCTITGYKRFAKHNGEFNASLSDFLCLPSIAYEYKVWPVERLLTRS